MDIQCSCKTLKLPSPALSDVYRAYTDKFVWSTRGRGNKQCVWSDGINIYYSYGTTHYKMDEGRTGWEDMTWNGLSDFRGENIWTDGTNIYHSYANSHHRLISGTNTWESMTFYGNNALEGRYIWTDGTNIYYSDGSNHNKLVKENYTWEPVTWNFSTIIKGHNIWTDGTDIYCGTTLELDKINSKWVTVTMTGGSGTAREDISAANIWTDGTNIYHSYNFSSYSYHRKFNKQTLTWEEASFSSEACFSGKNTWTDGVNIYNDGLVLLPVTAKLYYKNTFATAVWHEIASFSDIILFSINGIKYSAEKGMTWSEWIESQYNPDSRFTNMSGDVLDSQTNSYVCLPDGNHASTPGTITAGTAYILGD